MGQAKGSKTKIIFDTETTFKSTPTTVDAVVLPFVSESLRLSRNLIDSRTLRGTRNPSMPARGNVDIAGDITMELNASMGRLFKHVLGSVTTGGSGSTVSHVYKIDDLPAGMVIEKAFTGDLTTSEYFKYNGCKVNTFRITVRPEGFIETVVNIMGAAETVTTTSMDGSPTDNGFSPFDGFGASLKRGGSTLAIVTQIDLTIDNGLDGTVYVLDGTGTRYYLPEGMVKVSGTLTALFEDLTLYDVAIADSETTLELTFTRGTGAGTASNEKLIITMGEMIFQPQAPVITGPGGVLMELPFVAYYNDGSDSSAIKFELVNTIAAD